MNSVEMGKDDRNSKRGLVTYQQIEVEGSISQWQDKEEGERGDKGSRRRAIMNAQSKRNSVIHTSDRMWRATGQVTYKRIVPRYHPKSPLQARGREGQRQVGRNAKSNCRKGGNGTRCIEFAPFFWALTRIRKRLYILPKITQQCDMVVLD
jgi:hypothetical protein